MSPAKKLVVALIGPPGSGKGSYGRHLAKALNYSLIGMSVVLREIHPDLDLSSGKLVEDSAVTSSLQDYLSRHDADSSSGYLLDGFPRTQRQLEQSNLVDAAIQLAVPDFLCESKLIGRRFCPKCGGNFNVNGVKRDGWDLPVHLPKDSNCSAELCDWQTRADDCYDVVHSRLQTYHQHTDGIVRYFEEHGRLLQLRPFQGYDDVPMLIRETTKFLKKMQLFMIQGQD